MTYLNLDDVVENVIGAEFITRRTLMENLRPGRKYAGCASKIGNRWAFSDDDIEKLMRRLATDTDDAADTVPLDAPSPQPRAAALPSGMSKRSPRAKQDRWAESLPSTRDVAS